LHRRALLRLIAYAGIARRLEKCWGKTGVPVFLSVNFSICVMKNNETTEKPARGFFLQHFSREGAILRRRSPNGQSPFEAARKSSICTHQPEQSTRT
jgi:hypothetical protein